MANKRITDLTAATSLSSGDVFPFDNSTPNSRKITASDIAKAMSLMPSIVGTSFPGSPATGDRFWRSDRAIEYYYDGTRWLSTQLHSMPIQLSDQNNPRTSSLGFLGRAANPWAGLYDIYLLTGVFSYYLTATGNWTMDIVDSSAAVLATTTVSTVTTHTTVRVAINALKDNTLAANSNFNLSVTENSGTGNLYSMVALTYRLVG